MKAWFRMLGNALKTSWWVIVLILALVLFVFGGFLFTRRKGKDSEEEEDVVVKKTFLEAATNRVAVAVTDVKVERAVIKTKSEERRKELEEIRKEPDGEKRRERLAAVLRKSL